MPVAQAPGNTQINVAPVLVNDRNTTDTEYVRVPVTDAEGEAYRTMMRKMAKLTPALASHFEQLESAKNEILRGQKVQANLSSH